QGALQTRHDSHVFDQQHQLSTLGMQFLPTLDEKIRDRSLVHTEDRSLCGIQQAVKDLPSSLPESEIPVQQVAVGLQQLPELHCLGTDSVSQVNREFKVGIKKE